MKFTTTTKYLSGPHYTINDTQTKTKADMIINAPRGSMLYNDKLSHMALRGGEYITPKFEYYEATVIQFAHVAKKPEKSGAIVNNLYENSKKTKNSRFVKYGVMKQINMEK